MNLQLKINEKEKEIANSSYGLASVWPHPLSKKHIIRLHYFGIPLILDIRPNTIDFTAIFYQTERLDGSIPPTFDLTAQLYQHTETKHVSRTYINLRLRANVFDIQYLQDVNLMNKTRRLSFKLSQNGEVLE